MKKDINTTYFKVVMSEAIAGIIFLIITIISCYYQFLIATLLAALMTIAYLISLIHRLLYIKKHKITMNTKVIYDKEGTLAVLKSTEQTES